MVDQAVEDATRAGEIAIQHAIKVGFPPIFIQVVDTKRTADEDWDVTVSVIFGRLFRAKIDHLKGTVMEWSEVVK